MCFRLRSFLVLILSASTACSTDSQPDGGIELEDADSGDDWDGGVPRQRDATIPDEGVLDFGPCTCSYGFQQHCAENEVCVSGYTRPFTCERSEPFGDCSIISTATAAPGAACTAQCAPATRGSPCGALGRRDQVEAIVTAWDNAIESAIYSTARPGPNAMLWDDYIAARESHGEHRECGVFIQHTMYAAVALCAGDQTVAIPTGSHHIGFDWRFMPIEDDDRCRQTALGTCMRALIAGVNRDPWAAEWVDNIPKSCPNGLPYGAPCTGPDAQECLRTRINSMIRALNEG